MLDTTATHSPFRLSKPGIIAQQTATNRASGLKQPGCRGPEFQSIVSPAALESLRAQIPLLVRLDYAIVLVMTVNGLADAHFEDFPGGVNK